MARKRMVSPELFTSRKIAALPIPTRYTFVGLWCYCDDYGRGKDDAYLVKAAVWPIDATYTIRKVGGDLNRLEAGGQVCRYEFEGERLLHIPSWWEHQKPQHPTPSKLCPCPVHEGLLHEAFVSDYRNPLPSTKQLSVDKGSSRDLTPAAPPCPHGAARPGLCALCRRGVVAS